MHVQRDVQPQRVHLYALPVERQAAEKDLVMATLYYPQNGIHCVKCILNLKKGADLREAKPAVTYVAGHASCREHARVLWNHRP